MITPTNNLVVLFADISASTKLYEALGNSEAQETIDRCLGIVKRICEDGGGRVIKTIGDEVMAAFAEADRAAQAAIEIQLNMSKQRTSKGASIAFHIGFHSGPAIAPASVKLKHGTRDIELGAAHSVLTLGRDQQNDVMIADRKASRLHARIERRRDKFVLIDHSSNGTYVTVEGEPELALRREEL